MSDTEDPSLAVEGLRAGYGRIEILRRVDLTVRPGVTALLGANGAGKTTLLRTISGQLTPTGGSIRFAGTALPGGSVSATAKAGICLVPEGRGVFPNLTVEENLRLASYFGPTFDEVRERAYALFPLLEQRRTQKVGSMSGGEQQMLALGRALACRPELLLLDELSMGLAPKIVTELYEAVAAAASAGSSVLVVEQYAERALAVADTAAVMHGGRIVASGSPDEVRGRLAEFYLGGAA